MLSGTRGNEAGLWHSLRDGPSEGAELLLSASMLVFDLTLAKEDNVESLRKAGERVRLWADSSPPKPLSPYDKQKQR